MTRALSSALEFFFIAFTLFQGIVCVALGAVPFLRARILKELLTENFPFVWCGSALIAFSLLFLTSLAVLNRGRYYQVKMGVYVDPVLIRSLVERYWREAFSQELSQLEVQVGREITLSLALAQFPPETLLRSVERDLSRLLAVQLGLSKPFLVYIRQLT